MPIRIANVYLPDSDADQRENFRTIAEETILAANESDPVETVVGQIERSLATRFSERRFGISFHTYSNQEVPEETGARNSSLIDISVDDKFAWLGSVRTENAIVLPGEILDALARYRDIAFRYQGVVSWKSGFYLSDESADLLEFETSVFPALADRFLVGLSAIAKNNAPGTARIDAAFLLGYATDRESESVEELFLLLSSPDHSVHNMAARSLFPKAVARRCDFLSRASSLLDHQCSYCLNKFIGTASVLDWMDTERSYLSSMIARIRILATNKQPAVFLPARVVLDRLA
jgi:hypothetical protein